MGVAALARASTTPGTAKLPVVAGSPDAGPTAGVGSTPCMSRRPPPPCPSSRRSPGSRPATPWPRRSSNGVARWAGRTSELLVVEQLVRLQSEHAADPPIRRYAGPSPAVPCPLLRQGQGRHRGHRRSTRRRASATHGRNGSALPARQVIGRLAPGGGRSLCLPGRQPVPEAGESESGDGRDGEIHRVPAPVDETP